MQKKKPFFFSLPSRSLTYLKLVQGESNAKEKVNFLFIAEPKLRHPRCVARQILGNGEECFTSRQVDFPTRRVASSTRRVVRNSPPLVEGRSADV